MRYLSGEEILVIHSELIDVTGGAHSVRDVGLLLSLVERPRTGFGGKELYRGIHVKAAVYFESLAHYHVFIDSNKRTAVTAAARFLFLNGYELTATNKEVEHFTLKVVVKKLSVEDIAMWLKRYSRKLRAKK